MYLDTWLAAGLAVKTFSHKEGSYHYDVCKYIDHTTGSYLLSVGIYALPTVLQSN